VYAATTKDEGNAGDGHFSATCEQKGGSTMVAKEKSSTGLEENVAGFFCYILGFVSGIVFLVVEKESSFVKFHAKQSTVTFLILLVIFLVFWWIPVIGFLLLIAILVLWLFLMIKALQGERYLLPIVGQMVEEKTKP
jgi:uncharacterized membrane protein